MGSHFLDRSQDWHFAVPGVSGVFGVSGISGVSGEALLFDGGVEGAGKPFLLDGNCHQL